MKIDEMIKLIDAGFTKDEIMKLDENTPTPTSTPTPTPTSTPTPTPTPTSIPTPTQQDNDVIKNLTTQVTTLTDIIKTMQSDAIKNAGGGKPENKTSLDVVKDFFGQK